MGCGSGRIRKFVQVRNLLYIFIAVAVFACGQKEQEETAAPSEVLSEDAMVDVLIDLQIQEAALTMNIVQDKRAVQDSSQMYNVYKAHDITKSQFDESFRYYASKPEKLNAIYEQVVSRLNQMQTEAMKKVPKDTVRLKMPKDPMPGGIPH